jgi:cytokinin dehydrogenase
MTMTAAWPTFKGRLLLGEEARPGHGSDFGRLVTTSPRAALLAADVDDVVLAIRHARALGLQSVARGQGHTTRGQAQADDALVIDTRGLDRIDEPVGDTLRVQAGARWKDVVARALEFGLTPPVLTDYVDLTVGGTISVGGVGGQSFRHGLQVDNVLELEVITGRGERVRCSRAVEPDLFDACRGGLGAFGIVVEITLRLVAAPERVRVRHLPFADLRAFLAGQIELARAGTFDYLVGNLVPPRAHQGTGQWSLSVECAEHVSGSETTVDAWAGEAFEELPYLAYVTRLEQMEEAWRRSGSWHHHHPWIDLFVAADAAEAVIDRALEGMDADALGEGYVMTYPLLRAALGAPFPALPKGDALFLFDVLPSVAPDAPDRLAAAEARCERLFDAAARLGATVYPIGYPVGTPAMGPDAWARQLGGRHSMLAAVRERHDPDHVIGVGPLSASLGTR